VAANLPESIFQRYNHPSIILMMRIPHACILTQIKIAPNSFGKTTTGTRRETRNALPTCCG